MLVYATRVRIVFPKTITFTLGFKVLYKVVIKTLKPLFYLNNGQIIRTLRKKQAW